MDCTFVIFGATGDLASLKLIPAIYRIVASNSLDKFLIVGIGRKDVQIEEILSKAKKNVHNIDENVWSKLVASSVYFCFDFQNSQSYVNLDTQLNATEKEKGLSGNRVFYLATPSNYFETTTLLMSKSNLAQEVEGKWRRVVYEKPFGSSLKSAQLLNASIRKVFKESQIYRIDHYLGKELIGNLNFLRFSNRILEPLWNTEHISNVQIYLNEEVSVADRGGYYDESGAIKDVVQNHMLQILALTAMERPQTFDSEHIREEKAKVLAHSKITEVLNGQYKGYLQEKGVREHSKTETFSLLKLEVNTPRWTSVPFYLKTGKALQKKETSIYVEFKPTRDLSKQNEFNEPNYLVIRIQPDEGFSFEINSREPGSNNKHTQVEMDFCHHCLFAIKTQESYEKLLLDVVKGDQSIFVRDDEIENSWKIIDQMPESKEIYIYEKGSIGPLELKEFENKNNVKLRG